MMDPVAEHHVMALQRADRADTQEWLCPECGRHFIVRWDPEFDQLVLNQGDTGASHSGSEKGALDIVMRTEMARPVPRGEPTQVWLDWLRQHGIEDPEAR
ncbi:hypothetical protein BAY61_10190 [Prauserella marina]|uniref:Uncharacterized protein n=1 Tax=Prauserella marina TaxID=530584 RepID=A0A222VNG9_9PSEU|nr:hypothetical protein [Prauserella marina]ASR35303.1 hypothetical protein BAY61_10190 [Prauserella marina]PWV84917.1 hypothetical protein DES30_101936 [Prauserella marina]SDC09518.1 hypothetical protein SAMN05421630_101401 [Prauserella marina]